MVRAWKCGLWLPTSWVANLAPDILASVIAASIPCASHYSAAGMPWRLVRSLERLLVPNIARTDTMISPIDHLVLTVRDIERSVAFYCRVLGMAAVPFAEGPRALRFGHQTAHLHHLRPDTRTPAGNH